jgi:hypothetical protein
MRKRNRTVKQDISRPITLGCGDVSGRVRERGGGRERERERSAIAGLVLTGAEPNWN